MSVPFHAKPERRLKADFLFWAMAWAIPVLLVLSLPRKSFSFEPKEYRANAACAWVKLSEDDEKKALEAARTAWQMESAGMRGLRAELISAGLPEAAPSAIIPRPPKPSRHAYALAEFAPARVTASERALPPETLPSEAAETPAKPAFSRDDLLKLEERTLP